MIIIVATIISFTTYLSPSRRYSGQHEFTGEADLGTVNGEPVTREQFAAAQREGDLFFRLRYNQWPESEQAKKQVEQFAEQRLLLDAELKEYHINVTTEAKARLTKQLLGLRPDQAMPADRFQDFIVNDLGRKGGLTLEDFDRFVGHQAGQEYLVALFGMSGKLITADEAKFFYRRENEPMVTEMVSFPTTNYYALTAPTEQELEEYYTKHQADYRLPDRVQVNYIEYDASNYLARADKTLGTNLDERIDQIYHQQGPETFKDETGTNVLSPEAAAAVIRKQIRQYTALRIEAKKDANAFLIALAEGHDDDHPYTTSDMEKLAKAKGLVVNTTEPFDEKTGCTNIVVDPRTLRILFSLRENDPDDKERSLLYAPSPLIGENAVYVVGLRRQIPSQLQTLAQVHDKVVADYRRDKALELAKAAGEKFATALQAGAVQGKTFDEVCADEKARPQILTTFSLNTPSIPEFSDKSEYQQLQSTVFNLAAGQCSKFMTTAEGGYVVCVKSRLPVDEEKMRQELPAYLVRMREQRQVAAFEQWFGRQMQLHLVPPASERSTPVG